MFIDHRGGRTRCVFEVNDQVHFRHPESIISAYGLGWDEDGKQRQFCLSDIMTKMDDVQILECHLYDSRKTQELDMHKYTVKWFDKLQNKDRKFIVNEYDLWSPIK